MNLFSIGLESGKGGCFLSDPLDPFTSSSIFNKGISTVLEYLSLTPLLMLNLQKGKVNLDRQVYNHFPSENEMREKNLFRELEVKAFNKKQTLSALNYI